MEDCVEAVFETFDDSSRKLSTKFEYSFTYNNEVLWANHHNTIRFSRNGEAFDTSWLTTFMGIKRGRTHDGIHQFKIDDFILHVERRNKTYYVMGSLLNKSETILLITRILYKSCFTRDLAELLEYTMKSITYPSNVMYAIENRAPYKFVKDLNWVESRLNVEAISMAECAIEISDGIWANISIKDLDTFVNAFKGQGSKRSKKWRNCSPKKLWTMLMGKEPKETELNLMVEFLEQNRTQEIVEKRARELMDEMLVDYPDRIKIISKDNKTYMLVKGKVTDWIITDEAYKTQTQKVSTFLFTKNKDKNGRPFGNGYLYPRGGICIDNVSTTSSVGDQFAARAFALLNDEMTLKLVSTIRPYVYDRKSKTDEIIPDRLDWEYDYNKEELE
jgi:hypothetical protein